MLCGLEEISGGELSIGGQVVNHLPPAQRGIAMVFQSYALYPHMNVYQNMAFGLKVAGNSKHEIEQRIGHAAAILKIDHLLQRLPREVEALNLDRTDALFTALEDLRRAARLA